MLKYCTKIEIHHIFTSPKHNYFTRDKFDVGDAPTLEHQSVSLQEERGLAGDRFEFSKYPITLFSLEVAQDVCTTLELELDLKLFRRNIIVSGVHLNSLIGKRFKIGEVEFEGLAHCSPCTWMNAVMKKGAYSEMKGRGGLRAKVVNGAVLSCGEAQLWSEEELSTNPLQALRLSKIPKFSS